MLGLNSTKWLAGERLWRSRHEDEILADAEPEIPVGAKKKAAFRRLTEELETGIESGAS